MDKTKKIDNVNLMTSAGETFPKNLIETSNMEEAETYTTTGSEVKSLKQAILEGNIPGAYNNQYVRGKNE